MARPNVLLVEDDELLREVVAHNLEAAGFTVAAATDAGEAWTSWARADVVVLDWMLPDEAGVRLLARARSTGDTTPVIMLTARSREAERVEGLEAGADDYLVKPFSSAELVARLRALLRRSGVRQPRTVAGLEVDGEAGVVRLHGDRLDLTRREFELLSFLVEHAGRVFSRGELLDKVWGLDYVGTDRTVDQHVAQLRSRLGAGWIETVRGRGYRMARPDERR